MHPKTTTWLRRIGSLKVAVALLVLILVAMAAGTIVETARGAETAGLWVYRSAWFAGLGALLAINVACSIALHWPFGWRRTGFALTHGAILLILAGALVTDRFKIEGTLALWEGEESDAFMLAAAAPGGEKRKHALPFRVRLEAFEIDTYPGTRRPAMFRSRVVVTDPVAGAQFPAVIEMNRELAHGGFRFFQSSYRQTPERDQTVLAVSKDPGQGIVFAGYALLLVGMLTVFGTRVAQQRALARPAAGRKATPSRSRRRVAALALLLAIAGPAGALAAGPVPDAAKVDVLRRLPVQHDGRVMPLDTLARETVWQVTGRRSVGGQDPVATVLGWTRHGEPWALEPVVDVGKRDFASAIGVPGGARRAAFLELVHNDALMHLMDRARAERGRGRDLDGLLLAAEALEDRMLRMQGFFQGSAYRAIPPPGRPHDEWAAPPAAHGPPDLLAVLHAAPARAHAPPKAIEREILYNRVAPSRLAWWILAGAAAAALLASRFERRWLDGLAFAGLAAGFAVMTWGLATRWQIAGRIPASNMYESMLFLGWGVGFFALVAFPIFRSRLVVLNATAMAALTMALVDLLPVDPFIHPVQPVLAGTPWLAIHVPIIMLSYSVLALAVLVAHMQIGVEIVAPRREDLAARLGDLLYWYIHAGSILLIAGILAGSVWAASSWGRYWGWDPKEVWSLVAFFAYLAILHGRIDRFVGRFGVAAISIVAFWTIVMTYVGVNYVLAEGLHTYGSGGSAVARWMLLLGTIEAAFLAAGMRAWWSRRKRSPGLALHPSR